MTVQHVRADELRVGDIIWDAQDTVVTRVRLMSQSVAVYGQTIGKVGPEHGGAEWLLGHWEQVAMTRLGLTCSRCGAQIVDPLDVSHRCPTVYVSTGPCSEHSIVNCPCVGPIAAND